MGLRLVLMCESHLAIRIILPLTRKPICWFSSLQTMRTSPVPLNSGCRATCCGIANFGPPGTGLGRGPLVTGGNGSWVDEEATTPAMLGDTGDSRVVGEEEACLPAGAAPSKGGPEDCWVAEELAAVETSLDSARGRRP